MNYRQVLLLGLYVVLVLLTFLSPFWLVWWVVLLGVIIKYAVVFIFQLQARRRAKRGGKSQTLHQWYFHKAGLRLTAHQTTLISALWGFVGPLLLLVAIVFQLLLNHPVLVKF